MLSKDVLTRHANLVDRMADHIGVDIEEATLRGDASIDDITDAVLRCTACSDPDHCTAWLDAQSATGQSMPAYCRNSDFFSRLIPSE